MLYYMQNIEVGMQNMIFGLTAVISCISLGIHIFVWLIDSIIDEFS